MARPRKKTRADKGFSNQINRYLAGILFILMGTVIMGLTTYMISVIPNVSLRSTTSVESKLGAPVVNETLNVNVIGGYYQYYSFPAIPVNSSVQLIVVLDLTDVNKTINDISDLILYYNGYLGSVDLASTLQYGVAGGRYFVWGVWNNITVNSNADSIAVGYRSNVKGNIYLSIFITTPGLQVSANDIAIALGYVQQPPQYSLSNQLFLNFIGFAVGVVLVVVGAYRLGIEL